MTEKCDLVINLSGRHCPYSLMELNAVFKDMRAGAAAEIRADRTSAVDEVERWCAGTGNEVVSVETGGSGGDVRVNVVVRKA